jgi:hypothetical protein
MRILQNFVRETKGKWNANQWQNLLQRVRRAGFEKIEESRIGRLVSDNRERWLSGDNAVGPPPPGPKAPEKKEAKPEPKKPAEAKPAETKKPEAKAPEKVEKAAAKPERKEGKMPEQRKEEARPAAPAARPAAPAAHPAGGAVINPKDERISAADAQEQHQRRLAVLKRSQDLTQETHDTEIEIRRLENVQGELQRNLDQLDARRNPLENHRKRLQDDVDNTTKEITGLRANIDKLTAERAKLEESVGRRKRERSEHVGAIAHFKAERESLIT